MPVKKLKTKNSKLKNKTTIPRSIAKKGTTRGLTVDVFDIKGKVVEKMTLPKDVFGAKVNKQLLAQAVRVYLVNQRRGTASTKTRGEVRGSTRKIYRQKGTGRARHGGARAPIFVHGGIAFGPKPKDYSLKLPKKMKKQALFSALSSKQKEGHIKIVAKLEKIDPKTKSMINVLHNLSLMTPKKNILLVLPQREDMVDRSARNIEGVTIKLANELNTYDVLRSQTLLFMKEAIASLEKHFVKEGN